MTSNTITILNNIETENKDDLKILEFLFFLKKSSHHKKLFFLSKTTFLFFYVEYIRGNNSY